MGGKCSNPNISFWLSPSGQNDHSRLASGCHQFHHPPQSIDVASSSTTINNNSGYEYGSHMQYQEITTVNNEPPLLHCFLSTNP